MALPNLANRIAVCSWSLQAQTPTQLVERIAATGISRVQLAMDPLRDDPSVWGNTPELLQRQGIQIVSGMLGCVGEDYSTLETIRHTGGVTPDGTWPQNLANAKATAELARGLGLNKVTFHAGFLPHDTSDPLYGRMLERLRAVADAFWQHQVYLGFETGQETADALAGVLKELKRENIFVNFDPANMILYDKGDPVEAIGILMPWVKQVHIKDATRTKVPGTWGEEVAVGTGDVDWKAFLNLLERQGYQGDLVIEREAGSQRIEDIRTARKLLLTFA